MRTPISQKRPLRAKVSPEEYRLLMNLRDRKPAQHPPDKKTKIGEHLADFIAETMGSWGFIIVQSLFLCTWVVLNCTSIIPHWDNYPFILLNLMLSFQAAYSAPIIMMSQNRQAEIDRQKAKHNYEVNMKAELEIELLQDKMNLLREQELIELRSLILKQQETLQQITELLNHQATPRNNQEGAK